MQEAGLSATPGPRSDGHQPSSKLDAPQEADTASESERLALVHCLPPQALRSSKGLQQRQP